MKTTNLLCTTLATAATVVVFAGCASVTFTSRGHAPVLAPPDRTFAVVGPEGSPAGFHPTAATPGVLDRVATIARARMVADGFTERAPADARLTLRFGLGVQRHSTEVLSARAEVDSDVDVPAYTDAALVLDVSEGASVRHVWRGGAYAEITPNHVDAAQLELAVDGLVDRLANASRGSAPR